MIKEDELQDYMPELRIQNGNGITLSVIQKAIQDCADKYGIPVAFCNEQIKAGGLFKSKVDDCIVVYHPEHMKDYFKYVIKITNQGTYAFVSVREYGESKQLNKAYRRELSKQGVKNYIKGNPDDYNATGKAIGQAIGGFIGSLGKNKQKLEEEERYYKCLDDIFSEVFQ